MAKSSDKAFIKLGPAVEGNLVYINQEKFIQLFSVSHIFISGVYIGHSIFVSDNFRGPIEEKKSAVHQFLYQFHQNLIFR